MANMQIDFFRALKSVKIGSDTAQKTVESLEGHISMKISEANAPLISKLEAIDHSISTLRWLIVASMTLSIIAGTIGGYIAIVTK